MIASSMKGCSWDTFREPDSDFLMRVWNTYGQYSAPALRNKTLAEGPWREAFNPDKRRIEISVASMKRFFASNDGEER